MKKGFGYLVLLMVMIFPLHAKALTGSIKISCDKEMYGIGDTATCKVTGTSQEEVYSVSANVGDALRNINMEFQTDSSWQGNGDDGKIMLYTDKGKTSTFNIGTITLKVKEEHDLVSGTLYLDDSQFWDTDGKAWDVESNTVQVNFMRTSNGNTTSGNQDASSSKPNQNSNKKPSNSVTNPNTGEYNILIMVVVLIGVIGIFGISYNKFKKIK